MPSIIPSYQYDIFISYRHNDNRSGWVTAFVKNLQEELAATIKDPVSVYFDSNPYDGLLETHNVDKSLEAKLKCFIFIPILSQTYSDPKSFAWQHEFVPFNKLSQKDPLGRDIKLSNGNVASRILPVKIHDLDNEDKTIIENEIGGTLRAIEFIYKEPGVNRPLISSDNKNDNQNKTDYRNQVNKLANAIKEITYSTIRPSEPGTIKSNILASVEAVKVRQSLAVLPFRNMSSDAGQEYFSDGITENIIIELAANRSLKVISRTSVMRYKQTTKSAPEIAAELDVNYILEGGVQIHGNKVRITVQLVDAEKDDPTWSKVFVESMDDIFAIQTNVAEVVAKELHASIGGDAVKVVDEIPTHNLQAYDLYLKGRHAFNQWGVDGYKIAAEYYKQAIDLDPDFKLAYSALASSYSARMSWNGDLSPAESQPLIEKFLAEAWKRGPSANDYLTKAFVDFFIKKDFVSAEAFLIEGITLAPANADLMYTYSYVLNMMGRFEEAQQWILKAKLIEPLTVAYFNFQIITFYLLGKYDEALLVLTEAQQLYPSVIRFYDFKARIYNTMERWSDAKEAVLKGLRSSAIRPPSMIAHLASAHIALNEKDQSQLLLNELITRSNNNEKGVNINIVYIQNANHELPSAIAWLNKAKESNDIDLVWWNVDPLIKTLRNYSSENGIDRSPDFEGAEKHIEAMLLKDMPNLPYHNIHHIKDVLAASLVIGEHENISVDELKILRVAALLHDIGFIRSAKNHEAIGAEMAHEILPALGFTFDQIKIIENMILATRLPQSPSTKLERILCDADLDYLGRDDFYEIGNRLYEEMKSAGAVETEREWNLVQKTFLQSHRYHTPFSQLNREARKQERVEEVITLLRKRD